MKLLDPKLQAFLTVCETGTVHAAARKLHLTQTGVTQRIKALEKQLRASLFTRSRTGMKLAHEGEALYRYCLQAVELEGQALSTISGAETQASIPVTLAGPTSIVSSRIVPNCLPLYREFPGLLLSYRLDDQEDRVELLKKGIAQLAILSPQQVSLEMDSRLLRPDRYILVASAKWKGRRLSDILSSERMIDFYDTDKTTLNYLRHFGLLKSARPERIFANTNYALISLIKNAVGYGTLTQEVAAQEIEDGNLIALNQKQYLEDPLALAWYPRKEMPAYFGRIIAAVAR